jgi:hypothetical protein
MFTGTRASAWQNATHKQHPRTMIDPQIVGIGLKTSGISDANTSMRACLERYDDTGCVAITVERARLMLSSGYRVLGLPPLPPAGLRRSRVESATTATIVVAGGR